MKQIEIRVLNPEEIENAKKMMVCGARLTQRGHSISNMDDFMALYERPHTEKLVKGLTSLPHPTMQKLGVINIVVVGASRRFLAQITRHQNEVKFVSASLQYSDYSENGAFCVPYEILEKGPLFVEAYQATCQEAMRHYKETVAYSIDHDAAGYLAPQGLRNILIISATPYQWIHMIRQRSCRRNTKETQYVMLRIWEQLYELCPEWFNNCGPFCTRGKCEEGKMCCLKPMGKGATPAEILREDFPLLMEESNV